MFKTCKICGIVPYNHVCPHNLKIKQTTVEDKFRKSSQWTNKSIEIRKRDLYMCQICIRELHNTKDKYNTKELSVHHNIPITENIDIALDNNNLITLCRYHHELAESNKIKRKEIQEIINEQNNLLT